MYNNLPIAIGVMRATSAIQSQSDAKYSKDINECIARWSSHIDLSTRGTGIFTLVMLAYIDALVEHFFDRKNYPEHALLAVREGKKIVRDIERLSADLRRNCAPQRNTEWWPEPVVYEAVRRYKQQGMEHDYAILHYTLTNYLYKQKLDIPAPLYDLYLCICLTHLIDINVDCYSRSLINLDPLMADIINLPAPDKDAAAPGLITPLHLMDAPETRLHIRLREANPQLHRELSHRRFARTRPLRIAILRAINTFFPNAISSLPDSSVLVSDKDFSPVGQATFIMLNRANRPEFIRRATNPKTWEELDRIEQDYRDWLDITGREHDLQAVHEWKMQSEKCGEHKAAQSAVKLYEDTQNGTADPMPKDTNLLTPAALWLEIITELEGEWRKAEADSRNSFDTERAAMTKLHPDWAPEKVERVVSGMQYGIRESALMYDVDALRHHLDNVRPKGVTKKALRHELVQYRRAAKAKSKTD